MCVCVCVCVCIKWKKESTKVKGPMKALHASVCAQSLSCVRLFVTLWTVAHQAPLGILQARILEWVAMPSFRGSSQPRDQTRVS